MAWGTAESCQDRPHMRGGQGSTQWQIDCQAHLGDTVGVRHQGQDPAKGDAWCNEEWITGRGCVGGTSQSGRLSAQPRLMSVSVSQVATNVAA